MKKVYQNTQRSQETNRKDYHSPTRFPKKQFELIYREKEHLPSSQAFQSIIFMKSKKCQNKSQLKMPNKGKKQQVDNLKKVISKIQKQLKQDHHNNSKKDDENSKVNILKNKTNSMNMGKKNVHEGLKSKSSHRLNKYQKGQITHSQNSRKYKNMMSPVRNSKTKLSEQPTATTPFSRTIQETSRKDGRSKGKRSKKETENSFQNAFIFDEPEEYVLLENNFVELNHKDLSILNEKFKSRRQPFLDQESSIHEQRISQNLQQDIFQSEDENTLELNQQYESYKSSPLQSCEAGSKNAGNSLAIVQNYFTFKIKIIQRWWRSMLKKKVEEPKATIQNCKIDPIPKIDVIEADSSKSIFFGECTPRKGEEEVVNCSPIKIIEEFEQNMGTDAEEMQIIKVRQNAAKKQMETHLQFLEKIFADKKINSEVFFEKKEIIEARYEQELEEIEELRKVLRKNVDKTIELENNLKQNKKLLENNEIQVDNKLLDSIFGDQKEAQQKKCRLLQIPMIPNGVILQRQKSTGCHYNSQENVRTSLYKKQTLAAEQEEYREDFQDEDSQQQSNGNEFFGQNSPTEASMNNNFKQLFDEYKLRQEVKMEIDKRAAIQMGVMVEDIPPEIKDEFVKIDTSLSSIHRFILALFKFYIFYYKFDFLRLINMPFGYNIEKRIKMLQGYIDENSTDEDEDGVIYGLEEVIPENIFEEFYEKVYDISMEQQKQLSSAKKANFQFEKIHNRAIFDSFNEALNVFRPYFLINGPPFPWTNSEKALTFYFIAEQNIQQVFEKTQFKVLKWASSLCGIIVDKYSNFPIQITENQTPDSLIEKYQHSNHQILNETREDRLIKNERSEVEQGNTSWNIFEEQKTANLLDAAELIFDQLIEELSVQLCAEKQGENQKATEKNELQLMSENSSYSEYSQC